MKDSFLKKKKVLPLHSAVVIAEVSIKIGLLDSSRNLPKGVESTLM